MITKDRVADLAQRCGIQIDAFGSPIVDKFDMLVDLCRRVEDETEARGYGPRVSQAETVVPEKRKPGRPKKVQA